jgi:hypothetical protein
MVFFNMALKATPFSPIFENTALDFKGKTEIQQVEHIKKDMPTADSTSRLGYHFTVDVRCRTKHGHHFLVEMQNDFRDDYHMKTLAEHSRIVSLLDIYQTNEDQNKREAKNKQDANRFWKGIFGRAMPVQAFNILCCQQSHVLDTR